MDSLMKKNDIDLNSTDWLSTKAAARKLGIDSQQLRKKLKPLFTQGVHYYVVNPTAWRPTYRWHYQRCLEKLNEIGQQSRVVASV